MKYPIPVTQTRIMVPRRRSDLLSRPRLINLLNEMVDSRLPIIAAPAGYGKTSLLLDFASRSEQPVCWYSIDALDRDPHRFITYFVAAICERFPSFGSAALAALQNTSGPPDVDRLATIIVNEAFEHIPEHFLLVLDDYHLVDGCKEVNEFVSRFAQEVDENCHLLISSRTLLSLPDFPLMVARGLVNGLSYDELAFQMDEIQALFLQNYQISLSDENTRQLLQQSEGWVTGLLLSMQAMPNAPVGLRRSLKVSGVGVNEFLGQVLDNQTAPIQEFLLRSSLLEEFDARFCEEVIGGGLGLANVNWDAMLDAVLRGNLFVLPVGADGLALRFHHLFRDFLQVRMQRERPDEARLIHRRMAEVFTRRSDWESAHRYYTALDDTPALMDLIEQSGTALIAEGRWDTLGRWLDALPAATVMSHPALLSLQASVVITHGNPSHGMELFRQAIELLQARGDVPALARTLVRRATALRTLGDHPASLADADHALALCTGEPDLLPIYAEALRSKGMCYYIQGKLTDALTWLVRSLEVYQSLKDHMNEAVLLMETGLIRQYMSDYVTAENCYLKALGYWRETGNSVWQANVMNNLGFLQHMRGDYESAAVTMERALQHSRLAAVPRLEAFALANIGDLYRDLQAIQEARDAYRQAISIATAVNERFLLVYLHLAESYLNRLQDDIVRAEYSLASALTYARAGESAYELALCDLQAGLLHLHVGNLDSARQELARAADVLEADGQQVDAARACLYLGICCFSAGDVEGAGRNLAHSFGLVKEQEKQQPLVTGGWVEREVFAAMRENKTLESLLAGFTRQVKLFDQRLPSLRRRLRQRISVVPFAPPRMLIRALGRVQVRINDRTVSSADWQVQTSRDLFFLLLAHPEGMTKESVSATFWPDISPGEMKLRFKNTIYRMRHAVGKQAVVLQDDYYHFNRGLDYEYDVEEFQKAVRQAAKAATPRERISMYQTALRLYKGHYLPEMDAMWVITERERLYQMYIDAVLQLAELQFSSEQHQQALDTLQKALNQDASLEAAHRMAMRIHAALGNRAAVVRQYERCRQVLLEDYNAEPSPQTQSLMQTLMR